MIENGYCSWQVYHSIILYTQTIGAEVDNAADSSSTWNDTEPIYPAIVILSMVLVELISLTVGQK